MIEIEQLMTDNIGAWTTATKPKASTGKGAIVGVDSYGIGKLRGLILDFAVRGLLAPQSHSDQPVAELLEIIMREQNRLIEGGVIKKTNPASKSAAATNPFELPKSWVWLPLNSVGFTQTGGTPKKANAHHYGSSIPFLKPGDILDGKVVSYGNDGLSIEGLAALDRKASADSVLMVCIGTIGKCARVDRDVSFNQQINSVTPFVEMGAYLLVVLQSPYFQRLAWERSSSTTLPILNKGKWGLIPIPVPPLAEQRRIIEKVDELMLLCDQLDAQQADSIEAHKRLVTALLDALTKATEQEGFDSAWNRIAEHFDVLFTTEWSVDQLQQAIQQVAVMGKLEPQDRCDGLAADLIPVMEKEKKRLVQSGKIKKTKGSDAAHLSSPPYQVPNSWAWVGLSSICAVSTGFAFKSSEYTDSGVFVLRVTNISSDGGVDRVDPKFISPASAAEDYEKFQLSPDDVLLVMVGGSLGKIGVVPENVLPAVLNQNMWRFTRFGCVELQYFLMGIKMINRLQLNITKSTHGHLVQKEYMSSLFPLPPIGEQKRIVEKVNELMSICDALKSAIKEAQQTQLLLADGIAEQVVA